LLQAVQRIALLTTTDKTEQEIEQIKVETIKAAKMINLIEAQAKTEAFKQSEYAGKLSQILQSIRTDKVRAEAFLKDIEKITQNIAMDDIRLDHLNSDLWADKISKYSGAFRDVMIGLGIVGNASKNFSKSNLIGFGH
jgi:hypothetical protein